jgi:hypothetical protein
MTRKHPNQTFNSTGRYRREVTLSQYIDETASGDGIFICVTFACMFISVILFMKGITDPLIVMVISFTPVTITGIIFWVLPRTRMKVVGLNVLPDENWRK